MAAKEGEILTNEGERGEVRKFHSNALRSGNGLEMGCSPVASTLAI